MIDGIIAVTKISFNTGMIDVDVNNTVIIPVKKFADSPSFGVWPRRANCSFGSRPYSSAQRIICVEQIKPTAMIPSIILF
jgi:hypothetical protein